jgi:hypothetical protein
MRMHFAVRGVNHQPFIIRRVDEDFEQFFLHAAVTPTAKATLGVFTISKVWRQLAPWRPCAQYPKHCIDKQSII